ncbi:D-alanyl-D-alanine carboxypeptidase family protein [Moraxella oblonga]|uniref:D-alanyl-D-alanine carboxypeptidase family protein n=1 Tax=Moraxella oblonga TaxID=200413 RepID=UPI000B1741D5|nr:serine hydrolase [Moraxella oblonga]
MKRNTTTQTQFTKRALGTLSATVLTAMSVSNAHAFLVDNSQQKVIYIGKGDASNMQAVPVKEVRQVSIQAGSTEQAHQTQAQFQQYQQQAVQYQQQYGTGYNTQYNNPSYNNQPYQTQNYGQQTNNYANYSQHASSFERLALSTNSSAVAVYDLQTGQPIYEKNINTKRSIASITKMMTAMVLMDAGLNMNEEITLISSDLVGAKQASTNLRAGDRLTRAEFILMMLMKSENPAAKALARTYPGGYDAFISAMNQKAYSLGMTQTSFSDSSGLNPRNVSSASDLVKMMQAINSYPQYQTIRTFSTAPNYDFYINNYNSGGRTYKANNTNRLVRSGSYPIGASKTGYIREAGYCVVMETHVNNRPAVVVLLGASASNNRWNDAENILTQLAYLH